MGSLYPAAHIRQVKAEKTIKKPYTMEELERMREHCRGSLRDRAIIEVLLSTAARVSEVAGLNRRDIRWDEGEAVVMGKGSKERVVYFTDAALMHLRKYIDSRDDKNDALFVSTNKPHERLDKGGIEEVIRRIGRAVGVEAHPHKFRRTAATMAAKRGMPIEQVQAMLGHVRIDTTMRYACVEQSQVKSSYRRLMQ